MEGVRGTAGDANARLSGERACAEWCPRYIVVKMCRCERRFVFVRWRRPRIPTLDLNPESSKPYWIRTEVAHDWHFLAQMRRRVKTT